MLDETCAGKFDNILNFRALTRCKASRHSMATRSGEVGHGPDHNQSRHSGCVVHPIQSLGAEAAKAQANSV
ncbi:hypothetical protein P4119_17935 [Pseudomonas aeruginosa]|nr:hypothetical protein [Pseudomonas aeruginosa]